MKKKIILFALLLLSIFTFASKSRTEASVASNLEYRISEIDKPKTETIKIKTSAICEMCKENIEKKLAFTKGVIDVSVDLDSKDKITTVIFNPKKTNADKIRKAIADVGYDADGVLANPVGYEKLEACCKKGGMRE
jgi:periplasmic mercuric ion binding protein